MAKVTGYQCDVCNRVEQSDSTDLPKGWMKLHIITIHDRMNGGKDICSNKCLLNLARERVALDKPIRKEGFSEPQKEFIKNFLAELDITGKAMGARFATHSRYHSDGDFSEDCPVCMAITSPEFSGVE